jgi:hypothetical protein
LDDQARRGIDRDVDPFSSGQEPRRKARPTLTNLPGDPPGKRQAGVASLFGHFSLATQRKVTRLSADSRKPAAGEPGRRDTTIKR